MWRHYLLVAVRALAKNRTYAAINIAGLAIGLAACLLIGLFVREHLSFDRWVADADDVYQLQTINTDVSSGARERIQVSAYAQSAALRKDFPEVAAASFVSNDQQVVMEKGQPVRRTITLVGPDFLTIFPLRFIHGSAATALRDVNSVAMAQQSAVAQFGTDDVVGRRISVQTRDGLQDLRVSAVFAELPLASHSRMGMIQLRAPSKLGPGQENAWGWFSGYNYVRLRPGTDIAALNARLEAWKARNAPKTPVGGKMMSDVENTRFVLVPLPAVHLSGAQAGPAGNEMDRGTVTTFAVLALLILAMACVNFTNLATARASQRAREVSLRKVLGASRPQLVAQFLIEAVLIAAVAMLLALAVAELSLPWLRRALRLDLPLGYWGADGVLLPLIAVTLVVGVAAGLYPAFYLTRFQPARVLKANKSAAEAEGSGRLRNGLVVGQFAIAIGLIVCTAVVYGQTVHARSVAPGFERAGLLQIQGVGRAVVQRSLPALQNELRRVEGVRGSALTTIAMNTSSRRNNFVQLPGRAEPLSLGSYAVGKDYAQTMGMTLLAGRNLSDAFAADDATTPRTDDPEERKKAEAALAARGMNVVVNAESARQMGFGSPQAAIGRTFRLSGFGDGIPATIVGVVGDTRFRSAREPVEDMILYRDDADADYLVVRTDGRDPRAAMKAVEAAWKRVVPTMPFEARWSDDAAADLYQADETLGRVFAGFALLSVVIGCLGLFGLAAFTAERRTREIGIRKVLGARTRDIVRLLVWQFTRPVIVANLIAWPVAWWAMRTWLNGFDDRVALTPLPFLLAGGLALGIAVATIAGHAWRVAQAPPIRALRYE